MPRADTIPAVEVKLTRAVESTHMRHLRWLKRIIGDELVDPVVINTGNAVYREPRGGIAVVPWCRGAARAAGSKENCLSNLFPFITCHLVQDCRDGVNPLM